MKSLLSVLSLFVLVSTAPAAVLVNYTFSGTPTGNLYNPTNTNSELFPSNVASNTTASNIAQFGPIAWRFQSTAGIGMSIYPGNTAVNSSTSTGTAITSASAAVLQGSYFNFTLTAGGGFQLNMSSLTFDASKGGATSRGFAIQTSATGFSTDGSTNVNASGVVSAGTFTAISNTFVFPTTSAITLDLSGSSYQGLSSLEIRIFSYSPLTSASLEYDNFALNGSVVSVPEPATWALLAGAGTTLVVLRRRRRS